ncbi:hypothetical protein PFISCL1PPCAC_16835, partial [Pristionchus fissidentatus]
SIAFRRMRLLLLSFCIFYNIEAARDIRITLRQNITTPCPGIKTDIVDRNSIKFAFEMLSGSPDQNQVTVTDLQGNSQSVSFPGCYRVRMTFRVLKPLKNPYVEAFLQLGNNIPCTSPRHASAAGNVCSNVTDSSSWCPSSQNERVRNMLKGKQTCQFCNLCGTLDRPDVISELQQSVVNESGDDRCDTSADTQTVAFRMCTPTEEEIRRKHPDAEEKINEYWKWMKQGVLTAVVHVLDREEMEESKLRQCRNLCETHEKKRGMSDSYKATLLKSIDKLCTPKDEYAACVMHTLKFDVDG